MGGLGCDNMTVIIVGLLQGGSYSELANRCSERASIRRDSFPAHVVKQTGTSSYNGLRDALYGDISEDPHGFDGISPSMGPGVSKLNDTLPSANTDLDTEIKRKSKEFKEDEEDELHLSGTPDEDDGISDDENLSCDSQLDRLHPIETTV